MEHAVDVPPSADKRTFNEHDILGDLDRDAKGNVIVGEPDASGQYSDKQGRKLNSRGFLIDPFTGDVINNLNGKVMFKKHELDETDNLPPPFNVERWNFNPHDVRGDFDFDRKGKAMILRDKHGKYVDKRGNLVNKYGYRIDPEGNLIDRYGRKKLDKT
jgi:hypothetical protein